MDDFIRIRGAREHNLRSIDLDLPRNRLVVITGLSGSGKSSLAFDTIYADGQRRYVESLSAYARQFLELMQKPDVDSITGLSPAIAIEQKTTSRNPRSTVGTVTEIYDYLRLLYARIGLSLATANPTSGGSSERPTSESTVSPRRSPSASTATTQEPPGNASTSSSKSPRGSVQTGVAPTRLPWAPSSGPFRLTLIGRRYAHARVSRGSGEEATFVTR